MAKILLIVAIVVSLGTAVLGFLNQQKMAGLAGDLESTRTSLTRTQNELASKTEDLEKTKADLDASEKAKSEMSVELTGVRTQLEEAKAQASRLQDQLKQAEEQASTLRDELQAKETRIAELEAAQTGVVEQPVEQANIQEMENQLKEKETIIETLNEQLTAERNKVKELEERERLRSQQAMRQGLSGRILAVNPGWNFVVLNLGDRNGVVNNAEMLVTRGEQVVGKVRITSVEPSSSIADIIVNSVPRGMTIQPGDRVIYTGAN